MYGKFLRPAAVALIWTSAVLALLVPAPANARNLTAPRHCPVKPDDVVFGPPDPGTPGPFATVLDAYGSFADNIELKSVEFPVEFHAEVIYPEELDCGPFPIVFLMHGAHGTCVRPPNNGVVQHWPCIATDIPLPNHQGYRYFAQHLASHGMITVSISANAINANAAGDLASRAELFQRHIGYWTEANQIGNADFGTTFLGKVDLMRIGVVGHSRGGGAAAFLVNQFGGSDSPSDTLTTGGKSADIKAVLQIAPVPVDEEFEENYRITEAALGVILPYCDGDQEELWGAKYFDASRYALPGDSGPKHSFEVIGANHNYYNTFWDPNISPVEAADDWFSGISNTEGPFCQENDPDSGRLDSVEQQGTLLAIGGAFFRTYLRGANSFQPFLRGETAPPPSAMTDQIFVGYHPKDEVESRLDLNRLDDEVEAFVNTLGGTVSHQDLARFEFCGKVEGVEPSGCLEDEDALYFIAGAPHGFEPLPAGQLRLAWSRRISPDDAPTFVNELPEGARDVSAYRALQFRALVDFTDPLNPLDQPQDLRVVLRDGAGQSASVLASDFSRALFFPPPGDEASNDNLPIPHAIFNTVRVPLSAFPGLFLTDLRSVELVFDQTPTGAINVADFAFADEVANTPPWLTCAVAEPVLMATGDQLLNVGLDVQVFDDADMGLAPVVSVYSDEDDLDGGMPESSPDAKDIAPGTLRLRLENDAAGDGRVYLMLATAQDSAGKRGATCCTSVVPAGNQPGDLANVLDQADAALDQCTAFAAASIGLVPTPADYFVVGDGPVIGPQQ